METIIEAFSVLFVVLGPVDNAATFAALTKGFTPVHRRRTALKAVLVATLVMVVFAVFGDDILSFLGVEMFSLQIAGGILLLLAAIQMVMAEAEKKPQEEVSDKEIAIFPMAMPLIAGPDAIVSIAMLVSKAGPTLSHQAGVIAVMFVVLALVYLALLGSGWLVRLLGEQGIEIITRILGLLLAALAVEFIIEGLQASMLFSGT
ncbi:MAG: MarC family protein [Planctomycetota bacterium]